MTGTAGELRPAAAARHEVADGMRIDWNVPIVMDDGVTLRADVFRPDDDGRHPVILCAGPYGKGLHFADGFGSAWRRMTAAYPEIVEGTSSKYQVWEARRSRKVGAGRLCVHPHRLARRRPVGRLPGCLSSARPAISISASNGGHAALEQRQGRHQRHFYHATAGWFVGALRPPHLAAVCAWEGFVDYYRECARHGGMPAISSRTGIRAR